MTLIPIWSISYLPMVDMPHHAAQVSILRHYNDPAFGFEPQFRFQWLTPYAFAYYVSYLFSLFTSVLTATKIVITLSILSFPLALAALLRRTQGDPWWSLIGFATGFGFSFLWGLFNFLVALPIGVYCIARCFDFVCQPTRRNGFLLSLWMTLTLISHGIVFVMCGAISGVLIVAYHRRFRTIVFRMWPLLVPTAFALLWYLDTSNNMPRIGSPILWNPDIGLRLTDTLGSLLSLRNDATAMWYSIYILIAVAISARLSTLRPPHAVIFFLVLGIFLFGPVYAFGHALIAQRLSIFILIAALLVFPATDSRWRRFVGRGALVILTGAWLGIVHARFQGFDSEMRGFKDVLESAAPNRRLLSLIFDKQSQFVPNHPFNLVSGWYQMEKGGELDSTFAHLYNAVAQYRTPREPIQWVKIIKGTTGEWYWRKINSFDYILIRSISNLPVSVQNHDRHGYLVAAHSGDWWLLQRRADSLALR